jgi:hypothetical protein
VANWAREVVVVLGIMKGGCDRWMAEAHQVLRWMLVEIGGEMHRVILGLNGCGCSI